MLLFEHLEEAVNVHCPEQLARSARMSTLTAQIQYLRSRLDLLLEIESARCRTDEFPREHLFYRKARYT